MQISFDLDRQSLERDAKVAAIVIVGFTAFKLAKKIGHSIREHKQDKAIKDLTKRVEKLEKAGNKN